MFVKWIKLNVLNFTQKNKRSIKLWCVALYFMFEVVIFAAYLTLLMERNGKFNVIERDDFMNKAIRGLALISNKILLITLIIPLALYLVYRLYKSFRAAQQNYRNFVKNGGKIPTTEKPDRYDPYPKS